MSDPIPIHNLLLEKRRCINDILTVYNSDLFPNQKNTCLRVVDLLYKMGYYRDSESLFKKGGVK